MADHTKFVLLAQRLIAKQGRAITLRKMSAAAEDPDKPWNGPGEPTVALQVDTGGVFLPAGGTDFSSLSISKEMLARVTQVALVAPNDAYLGEMDVLLDTDNKTYKIEWVSILKPADQICLYAFGVAR